MVAEAAPQAAETDQLDWTFWLAALVGLTLTALTMTLVLTSDLPGDRGLIAVGRALVIAVPVGIGLSLWRYRADKRVGQLLVVAGCIWFLPTLAESSNEVVYSVGRVGGWLVEPVLLYVILSVPSGRLAGRAERAVVAASALLVLVLYLPTALLVESYPEPFPFGSCGVDCPSNAFMLAAEQPAFVDDLVRPLRDLISVALYVAVLVILVRRYRASTQLMRLTLVPVIVAGLLRAVCFITYTSLRRADANSSLLDAVAWVYQWTLPAVAVAILVGLLRSRLYAGEALQRLAVRLRHHARPGRGHGGPARDNGGSVARARPRRSASGPVLRRVEHRHPTAGAGAGGDGGPGRRRARHRPHSRRSASRPGGIRPGCGVARTRLAGEPAALGQGRRVAVSSCRSRARGSRRPPTASDSESSATCTTARSSVSLPSGSSLGLAGDIMREDPDRGAQKWSRPPRRRSRGRARGGALASRRACPRRSSRTRGSRRRCRPWRRSAPVAPCDDQRPRRPFSARDRERRLLLLPRGAPERREAGAERASGRSRSRSTSTTRFLSSSGATTAADSPATRSGPASASRACTTGSPPSAGG